MRSGMCRRGRGALWERQRHLHVLAETRSRPIGVSDDPGALATAEGDRSTKCILQGAAFKCRIDAGLGDGAGGTRRVIRGTC